MINGIDDMKKMKKVLILSDEGNVLMYNVPQLTKARHLVNDAREILQLKSNKPINALHNIKYYKNKEIYAHLNDNFKKQIPMLCETYVPKGYFHIIDYKSLYLSYDFMKDIG